MVRAERTRTALRFADVSDYMRSHYVNPARAETRALEELWQATLDFATDNNASWGAVLRALKNLEHMQQEEDAA